MLHISASGFLGQHSLQNQIIARHQTWWSQAQELANEASGLTADGKFNASGVRNELVARQLASALPALSILIEPDTHPKQLYQALAQVVGQIGQSKEGPEASVVRTLTEAFARDKGSAARCACRPSSRWPFTRCA